MKSIDTNKLRGAALHAMRQIGLVRRLRGKAQCWELNRGGTKEILSIKTTRDRWFGFQPPVRPGNWGPPLDRAQSVVVAALNDLHAPTSVQVYLFPASEVRARLDEKWAAELAIGRGRHAAWLHLDVLKGRTDGTGSGLAEKYPPIAEFQFGELEALDTPNSETDREAQTSGSPSAALSAVAKAKAELATALGISPNAIEIIIRA